MRLVVVGGGLSSWWLFNILTREGFSDEVVLIEKKPLSFKKHLLFEWLIDKAEDDSFFIKFEEFSEKFPSFSVIRDKAIRINFERKVIFFKDNRPLEFDKLVLACGLKSFPKHFSGVYKEGVYFLGGLKDPTVLKEHLHHFSHIIVYIRSLLGLKLAVELSKYRKFELKVVFPDIEEWVGDSKEELVSYLEKKEIGFYCADITEAIGEGWLRAIKLSSGKFLACELLILDNLYLPDLDLIKDNPQVTRNGELFFDEFLNLGYRDCFICGDVSDKEVFRERFFVENKERSLKQAEVVAQNLLGRKTPLSFEKSYFSSRLIELISP